MKVYELMSVLAKMQADADVLVSGPGLLASDIHRADNEDGGSDFVTLWVNEPLIEDDESE